LKTPLLAILLITLLTKAIFAEENSESKAILNENSKTSWIEIFPMIDPQIAQKIGAVIDQKIELAFNEGYKAASIRFAPELEFWKIKSEENENCFFKGLSFGVSLTAIAAIVLVVFQLKGYS
jgi:hypothetical protein